MLTSPKLKVTTYEDFQLLLFSFSPVPTKKNFKSSFKMNVQWNCNCILHRVQVLSQQRVNITTRITLKCSMMLTLISGMQEMRLTKGTVSLAHLLSGMKVEIVSIVISLSFFKHIRCDSTIPKKNRNLIVFRMFITCTL